MKTITLKNLTKSYDNQPLFEDVSFSVTKGDRIAITGANGVGKSTLLRIITGAEQHDAGSLQVESNLCRYVPQAFSGDIDQTILEYLDGAQAHNDVFDIIRQFGVMNESVVMSARLDELSGGQQRIVEIAVALSRAPMFLCIDEPENHLDIQARSVLADLLQQYWGSVLFVSHDRHLINQVASKIFALKPTDSVLMSGVTYEEFVAKEAQDIVAALADWKAEARTIKKMEDNVRLLKARTRYGDTQAKTYQMKKRQLAERQQAHGTRPDLEKSVHIEVAAVKRKTGKLIFGCDDVSYAYGTESPVLKGVSAELRFGDRVVLLGRNGSGKTTLLKLMQEQLTPTAGTVRVGVDVAIAYVDQLYTLDAELSPLEHFRERGYEEESARSILSQFGFAQAEATMALKVLSGGQRQRFTFLLLFKTNPECVVLDEPTNNLDEQTWQLLLRLINEYTGSLLLVTHDRAFIEQLQSVRFWVLENNTVKESWDELDQILQSL